MQDVPYGCCHCGCGQKTTVPKETSRNEGRYKGVPMRFVHGHHRRGQRFHPRWREENRGYSTACWVWLGFIEKNGYGKGTVPGGGRMTQAHRAIYEELVGPIPKGLDLDHLCRVRECVNPDHLEPVTRAENLRRGAGKGGTRWTSTSDA